jgi:hypothetical protein
MIFGLCFENKFGEFLSKSLLASQNCDRMMLKKIWPFIIVRMFLDMMMITSMNKGWAS